MGARGQRVPRLSDLIASAYEGALEAKPFATLLPQLARLIGADAGMLVLYAPELGAGELPVTHDMPADLPRIYREHFWAVDLWRIEMEKLRVPSGKAVAASTLVPFATLRESEMYNDALRPYGFFDTCATQLGRDGSIGAAISMLRARPRPFFGSAEVRSLDALAPHLARAFALHRRFAALIDERASLATVVDRLAGGALLCDRQGFVVHATPRAKRLLDRGHPLYAADGRLRARVAALDARISTIIAGAQSPLPAAVDLPDGEGVPLVRLTFLPVADTAPFLALRGARVLIVIDEVPPRPASGIDLVAARCGLTPAEARLLRDIVGGATLREAAERRHASVHTARNQLKQILHKTGCRRQLDVVRLCLTNGRRAGAL